MLRRRFPVQNKHLFTPEYRNSKTNRINEQIRHGLLETREYDFPSHMRTFQLNPDEVLRSVQAHQQCNLPIHQRPHLDRRDWKTYTDNNILRARKRLSRSWQQSLDRRSEQRRQELEERFYQFTIMPDHIEKGTLWFNPEGPAPLRSRGIRRENYNDYDPNPPPDNAYPVFREVPDAQYTPRLQGSMVPVQGRSALAPEYRIAEDENLLSQQQLNKYRSIY